LNPDHLNDGAQGDEREAKRITLVKVNSGMNLKKGSDQVEKEEAQVSSLGVLADLSALHAICQRLVCPGQGSEISLGFG
jgi:hypothetical protein